MATYKVIQDIEAEDKLVGPFSLRQFIYAAIAVLSAFIAFKLGSVNLLLITPFLPVIIFFGVLAAPFGHDQPSEVWLLARARFFLKPHKRIWNQTGALNLVTITVPKVVARNLTNGLSQTEVTSRLHALANTIDSRGWAIKNVNVNLSDRQSNMQIPVTSDRLIDPASLPQDVPSTDITPVDDMFDSKSNPTAQHLDQMINVSTQQHRQQVIDSLSGEPATTDTAQPEPSADYWFMNDETPAAEVPEGFAKFQSSDIVTPGEDPAKFSPDTSSLNESAILEQLEHNKQTRQHNYGHMHVVEPLSEQAKHKKTKPAEPPLNNQLIDAAKDVPAAPEPTPATTTTDPAIINLAMANSNNWSVATQAHQADVSKKKEEPPDEVIIALH